MWLSNRITFGLEVESFRESRRISSQIDIEIKRSQSVQPENGAGGMQVSKRLKPNQ